jgi:hypothetical protein
LVVPLGWRVVSTRSESTVGLQSPCGCALLTPNDSRIQPFDTGVTLLRINTRRISPGAVELPLRFFGSDGGAHDLKVCFQLAERPPPREPKSGKPPNPDDPPVELNETDLKPIPVSPGSPGRRSPGGSTER